MPRENKTQYAILGCLSIRPMSAYDIKNFMAKTTAYFWIEHEAQLYPTLKKLEKDRYLLFQEEKAQKQGVRKIYSLTQLGKKVLKEWIIKKPDNIVYRNECLLKLFFGNNAKKDATIKHIVDYRAMLEENLRLFQEKTSKLSSFKNKKRKPYVESTLRYGVIMTEAEIKWCDETLENLQK